MAVISNEGFDIRVAGMQGSLGAGTYFAGTGSNLDSLVPYLASHLIDAKSCSSFFCFPLGQRLPAGNQA